MKPNEKKIAIRMIAFAVVIVFFLFVLPVILYMKGDDKFTRHSIFKKNTQQQTINDENTDIEDSDEEISEVKDIEEEIEDKIASGQKVDEFYTLIMDRIEEQKQNPFIVIPYDYVPSDNYLKNAADETGKISVYKKSPIMVYVPEGEYFDAITQAFVTYNYEFKGLIGFKSTKDPKEADIKVVLSDDFGNDTDIADAIGLGAPRGFDEQGNITSSEIKVLNKNLTGANKVSMVQVYNVILHEIGHAIGIQGHSPNERDVLYYALVTPPHQLSEFSERDKETLKLMYSRRKDLLATQLQNVQQEKLEENLAYAKESNNSDAYLAVADSYYYSKQYDEAVKAYAKALQLNPENPRIYIKLAACYIVAKKYDDAIRFARIGIKKAKTPEQVAGASHYMAMALEEKHQNEEALSYRYDAMVAMPNEKAFFMSYLYACYKMNRKDYAREAYEAYIDNYDQSEFSEYEVLLVSWVRSI